MGSSAWNDNAYANLQSNYSTKSTAQIFTSTKVDNDMSPKGVKFRESRDSVEHPDSVATIVALDETGSMGDIPAFLIKNKLGTLMETLINHNVPDAHVLFGGVGDHYSDKYPLQVGQFEAGTEELNNWLTKIYLEGNGGGQRKESYSLAWLFAARNTSIDCFEKRGEKGFLFTIGDEGVHETLEASILNDLFETTEFTEDISSTQLLAEAQRMYNVFHLHIKQTGTGSIESIQQDWKNLLGENVIMVEDYKDVAEIIASTVAVIKGANLQNIVKDFDATTAGNVSRALSVISNNVPTSRTQKDGVITL